MKIVHASHFSIRKGGANFYAVQYKLSDGLTRLGHFVFPYSDRDMASAHPLRIRGLGAGQANRKLEEICDKIRPDLLLLGHCPMIRPETITTIRAKYPAMRVAHWNCDGLFVPHNLARLKMLAPLVDASFVTTAGPDMHDVIASGGRVAYMPNPVDKSIESLRAFERSDAPNDLVFLTGSNPYDAEKQVILDAIRSRLPDLRFDIRGRYGVPGAYGADLFEALANARMGLNLSSRNDVYLYSSDRMSQLMGSGLLTFVDRRTRFSEIFAGDELVTYEGSDELIERLDYYRRHDDERRAIAERGWRRVHEIFNETIVAQWILDVTFDRPFSRTYAWPTEIASIDVPT